jgi:hypothetical protein
MQTNTIIDYAKREKTKMKKMLLSAQEVLLVQINRGRDMVGGYPCQFIKIGGEEKYYFWPWGKQPNDPVIGNDPVDAAKKFLRMYHKTTDSELAPRRRKPAVCPECNRELP